MIVAGIDPGISPALSIVSRFNDGSESCVVERIPEEHHWFDPAKLRKLLLKYRVEGVVTEVVGALPQQGVSSTFRFAFATGTICGVVVGLQVPLLRVTPSKWKREVLADYDLGDDNDKKDRKKIQKAAACKFVHDRFPDVSLQPKKRQRTDDIDLADAVCLAVYGLNHYSEFVDG